MPVPAGIFATNKSIVMSCLKIKPIYKDMWLQVAAKAKTTQLVYPKWFAPLCLVAPVSSWFNS